jgi:murein DD-endopeptidase MepM/ murein hydrolase activator NlpD
MNLTQLNEKPKVSDSLQSLVAGLVSKLAPEKMANSAIGDSFSSATKMPNLIGQPVQPTLTPEKSSKFGSVDTGFFTTVASSTTQKFQIGDNASTVATKYYSLLNSIDQKKKVNFELERDFEKESENEEKRKYESLLKKIDTPKEVKPIEKIEEIGGGGGDGESLKIPKMGKGGKYGKMATLIASTVGGAGGFGTDIEDMLSKQKSMLGLKEDFSIEGILAKQKSMFGEKGEPTAKKEPASTQAPQMSMSNRENLKVKISGKESAGSTDASYNIMNKGSGEGNSNMVTTGNKDVDGKPYQKNLTEMTIGEVVALGGKRSSYFKKSGMGAAAGKYQFMPDTISSMAQKALGGDWQKEPFSAQNQEKMMDSLIDYEAAQLKSAGVPVTDAGLYLVHFLGNGQAAAKILNAKDDEKMSNLLSSAAQNANPRIASMTVGQYKDSLKSGKSGFDFKEIDINATTATATPSGTGRISSGFGQRIDPISGQQSGHLGIDIAAGEGTQVNSTSAGTVVVAGLQPGADKKQGYGNLVVVDHGNGIVTKYAHLSSIDVKVGDKVQLGQKVGAVGSTGYSTGPHLHYEILKDGKAVDPQKNALSQVNPVGQVTSAAMASSETGQRIDTTSTQNNDLRNQRNTVAVNNPKTNMAGTVRPPRIMTAPDVSDYPLVPSFVMSSSISQMST